MPGELNAQKAALRNRMRAVMQKMAPAARAQAAAQARSLLERQTIWKQAGCVLFFAPLPEELDAWPLLQEAIATGKTAALPRYSPATHAYAACRIQDLQREIRPGQFGIREPAETCEPIPPNRLDLVLVPGIAFDRHGRRLGRGKGFYDQLLATVDGAACGVAFDEQIVDEVPAGPLDVRVGFILTPTRWVEI